MRREKPIALCLCAKAQPTSSKGIAMATFLGAAATAIVGISHESLSHQETHWLQNPIVF